MPRLSLVQAVAVVRAVPDQRWRDGSEKRVVDRLLHERDLVWRSTCDANGDRKTSSVCDRHDLCALPALRLPDGRALLFAPAKILGSSRSAGSASWQDSCQRDPRRFGTARRLQRALRNRLPKVEFLRRPCALDPRCGDARQPFLGTLFGRAWSLASSQSRAAPPISFQVAEPAKAPKSAWLRRFGRDWLNRNWCFFNDLRPG